MPGQYGSNGINSDGSLMNVGNKLGEKPSIKLFPKYNSGDTMRALLADCGGLGDGLGDDDAKRRVPSTIAEHEPARQAKTVLADDGSTYKKIPFRSTATNQFQSNLRLGQDSPVAPKNRTKDKDDPDKMSSSEAQKSLWEGARLGDTKLVKQALQYGADATAPNPTDGWLALHYAAVGNRRLTCQHLLSLPSAPQQATTKSKCGETPASLCRNEAVKAMIVEAAARA